MIVFFLSTFYFRLRKSIVFLLNVKFDYPKTRSFLNLVNFAYIGDGALGFWEYMYDSQRSISLSSEEFYKKRELNYSVNNI